MPESKLRQLDPAAADEQVGEQVPEQVGEHVPGAELGESERIVGDALGRLMEFWGFKRNMGRLWAVLYLSARPLGAAELRDRLGLSSGAVSMTVAELMRWGVVHKTWVAGDRRDYFEAEGDVWKMVSRVLRERERLEIDEALDALQDALRRLGPAQGGSQGRAGAEFARDRIRELIELARLGRTMVDAIVDRSRVDASWLTKLRLGSRRR